MLAQKPGWPGHARHPELPAHRPRRGSQTWAVATMPSDSTVYVGLGRRRRGAGLCLLFLSLLPVLRCWFSAACVHVCSCDQLFVTPWTIAPQAPLSMGFSRQEYWSGLPFPPPGDLPSPGTEPGSPVSPALQVDSLPLEPLGKSLLSVWLEVKDLGNNQSHSCRQQAPS